MSGLIPAGAFAVVVFLFIWAVDRGTITEDMVLPGVIALMVGGALLAFGIRRGGPDGR